MVKPADVYYVDARASREFNLLEKLRVLFDSCGVEAVVSEGDEVAVKVHWGNAGCTRYLRADYVRVIVEGIKGLGGNPFVCESAGFGYWKLEPRTSGRGQLSMAYTHGYLPETVGAPIAIIGGMMGSDTLKADVPDGIQLKEAYVAKDLVDVDAIVVVSHFKGHCRCGFGGALKHLGVGGLTKEGKAMVHRLEKPEVDPDLCDGCGVCVNACPSSAIRMVDGKAVIDAEGCSCCWACVHVCPKQTVAGEKKRAITFNKSSDIDLQVRFVDQLAGLLRARGERGVFYFNFLLEVTPNCDCESFSDVPIVPDIGILASKDPVAIDQASLDLVNAAPGIPNSRADEVGAMTPGSDKFRAIWPNSEGGVPMLEAAEKLRIGSRRYRLLKVQV